MGEILIPRRTKVEKGYELLADITVGTATTSVDIAGLNIGKGDEVVLVSDIYNSTGTAVTYLQRINATPFTYYTQYLSANGTSVTASRYSSTDQMYLFSGTRAFTNTSFKLTNSGYAILQNHSSKFYGGSVMEIDEKYITTSFLVTSITQFSIIANITNGIGIGSRFQLYRIGGA